MIKFDVITIFPKIFKVYFSESIISQAQKKGLIKIGIHDLRKWTENKHKTVDDKPFGGGRGMVMKVGPIYRAVKDLKKKNSKVVLFTPRGKKYNQKTATEFCKEKHFILICGRYEAIDERVSRKIADINLSMGNYVLMGGELPAMAVIESVSRLVPGVIGKPDLLKERITKKGGFIEYPQYTRPEEFKASKKEKWRVPKVLLSGNHKEIKEWREKHRKIIEK